MPAPKKDALWSHLYPAFRTKLQALFADCKAQGLPLQMCEGYRSVARQEWLYEQGRTRPGAIVTHDRIPVHHGKGLAADCYPVHNGRMAFAFTDHELHVYRAAMAKHGLHPTAMQGDLGHVELRGDSHLEAAAAAWCKAGFPAATTATKA